MKVLERVLEKRIRERVVLDEMQFGFSPGRGTVDAIFIVRQVQEKFLAKKKELWMAFVDFEKAFDRVRTEVIWWALRVVGVEEWIVKTIHAMYEGATTAVRLGDGEGKEFGVKVGVHQGTVLSPLLFTIVLEALSRDFRGGLPFKLLHADDLDLMAESKEDLTERFEVWISEMEAKGLRVNMGKTKIMVICAKPPLSGQPSGKWPCWVYGKGVGQNSILCTQCNKWIHKKCSGVKGSLESCKKFQSGKCPLSRRQIVSPM